MEKAIRDIEEEIRQLEKEAEKLLTEANSEEEVDRIRINFVGKKGKLTQIIRALPSFPPDKRPLIGKLVNEVKEKISAALEARRSFLQSLSMKRETVDVTLPGVRPQFGRRHPLTQVIDEIKRIFIGLGFEVVEG
ncbi:MAG: phenylalanine--tRNA ligase subunit alpha, partial [bacterium]